MNGCYTDCLHIRRQYHYFSRSMGHAQYYLKKTKKKSKEGFIYFVHCKITNRYKIGFATNITRIKAYTTHCPVRPEIKFRKGTIFEERFAHALISEMFYKKIINSFKGKLTYKLLQEIMETKSNGEWYSVEFFPEAFKIAQKIFDQKYDDKIQFVKKNIDRYKPNNTILKPKKSNYVNFSVF